MPPTSLCQTLQDSAGWVWSNTIERNKMSVPFSEETITEQVLWHQTLRHRGRVQCIAYNKAKEGRTGADWEWLFVSPRTGTCVKCLVQAKRLYLPQIEYHGIWRTIGKSRIHQIDRLLCNARTRDFIPLYCFYNGVDGMSQFPSTLCSGSPSKQIESYGCTLAHAQAVYHIGPTFAKFKYLSYLSLPWQCIVCCDASNTTDSLPERVLSGLRRLAPSLALLRLSGATELKMLLPDQATAIPDKPTEIPEYAKLAMELGSQLDESRINEIRTLSGAGDDVSGVVIFSEPDT